MKDISRPGVTTERRARGPAPREQDHSPFSVILGALVQATPLSLGAALVDSLGETVDYAGNIDPFDMKVSAAHFQLVFREIRAVGPLREARELTVRAKNRSYVYRVLDDEYALMLVVHRHGAFAVSRRALSEAAGRLCREAGLAREHDGSEWHRVGVETTGRRPQKIRSLADASASWSAIEVMGTLTEVGRRERGYRVRLQNGAEMNLVRERSGLWFVDERP